MNLTNEEIRIKIAKSLGWVKCGYYGDEQHSTFSGITPHGGRHEINNYPESLDACKEFEKTLTSENHFTYI